MGRLKDVALVVGKFLVTLLACVEMVFFWTML
jgi:hypothetical protein